MSFPGRRNRTDKSLVGRMHSVAAAESQENRVLEPRQATQGFEDHIREFHLYSWSCVGDGRL